MGMPLSSSAQETAVFPEKRLLNQETALPHRPVRGSCPRNGFTQGTARRTGTSVDCPCTRRQTSGCALQRRARAPRPAAAPGRMHSRTFRPNLDTWTLIVGHLDPNWQARASEAFQQSRSGPRRHEIGDNLTARAHRSNGCSTQHSLLLPMSWAPRRAACGCDCGTKVRGGDDRIPFLFQLSSPMLGVRERRG
jgi:hypothetical protein